MSEPHKPFIRQEQEDDRFSFMPKPVKILVKDGVTLDEPEFVYPDFHEDTNIHRHRGLKRGPKPKSHL